MHPRSSPHIEDAAALFRHFQEVSAQEPQITPEFARSTHPLLVQLLQRYDQQFREVYQSREAAFLGHEETLAALAETRIEAQEAQEHLSHTQAKLQETTAELTSLRQEVTALEARWPALWHSLQLAPLPLTPLYMEMLVSSVQGLSSRASQLTREAQQLQEERDRAAQQLAPAQKAVEELTPRVAQLTVSLTAAEAASSQMETLLKTWSEVRAALESETLPQDLLSGLPDLGTRVRNILDKIGRLRTQRNTARTSLRSAEARATALQERADALQATVHAQSQTLALLTAAPPGSPSARQSPTSSVG